MVLEEGYGIYLFSFFGDFSRRGFVLLFVERRVSCYKVGGGEIGIVIVFVIWFKN